MRDTILIVDEEQTVRRTLAEALQGWGYRPVGTASASDAITFLESEHPAAVLLDMNLAGGSSTEVLRKIKQRQPEAAVIVITASLPHEDIIGALHSGGDDFIGKPINLEELEVRIRNRIEIRSEHKKIRPACRTRPAKVNFDQIVGRSPVMRETLRLARRVAESEVSSLLLQGESGTGKDMLAKAIHYSSTRADRPFITINCAALPPSLIESELFGHERGAFTDAKARKEGLLEQANGGGTIFLDEISELDISLQAKLLRVLEEGAFRRVGGLRDVTFNARVIAASNREIKRESEVGRFRRDLYYRLAVIEIDIPRLSERGDDVLLLAQHFIASGSNNGRGKIKGLTSETVRAFRLYGWPGNVRELRNAIERATILEEADMISTTYLPRDILADADDEASAKIRIIDRDATISLPRQGISLDEVETSLLKQALTQASGNQTRAADLLGLTRDQFRYRLKKLRESESSGAGSARTVTCH